MSRMSYLIQEIHFKSDIFFPYAPYKNEEGTGGRGMLSIPKARALLLFHCPVRTAVAAGFPHWFLLPALQMDPGEPDTVLVSHLAWGKLLSLHATVHPLWQRTDSPSVWYCKGAFINVSKAVRTVAVEPVQCEVTLSVL